MTMEVKAAPMVAYFKAKPPIDYVDTTLTINTYEDVVADLSGGVPCEILLWIVEQTNNGATNEDLRMRMTIGGTVYSVSLAGLVSGTNYYVFMQRELLTGDWKLSYSPTAYPFHSGAVSSSLVGYFREVVGNVEIRQETAVDGTSAQIEVNVVWGKLTKVAI